MEDMSAAHEEGDISEISDKRRRTRCRNCINGVVKLVRLTDEGATPVNWKVVTLINFKVPGEKSDAYEAAEKKRTLLV